MPEFKIGTEEFVDFSSPTQWFSKVVQVLEFDNVKDAKFRILEKKGRPFSIETLVDVPTADDGWEKIDTYTAMIEEEAKQVIFADHDFDDEKIQFKVLRVTPGSRSRPPVQRAIICGGLNNGNHWVAATFEVQPVELP